jgi:hypothetical protein
MKDGIILTALGGVARCQFDELSDMQRIVGGYIEAVDFEFEDRPCIIWLNEEGKLNGLPLNGRATLLAQGRIGQGDYIVGDVLITGGVDGEGNTLSIDKAAADAMLHEKVPQ